MLGSDINSSEISSSLSDLDHFPSPSQIYKQDSSTLLYKSGAMIISAIYELVSQKQFSCTDFNTSVNAQMVEQQDSQNNR